MKVDVWKGTPPEVSWVVVTRRTKSAVVYETVKLRENPKSRDIEAVREERLFSRRRLERVESARRGEITPGRAVIHWVQSDKEPIMNGEMYRLALFNCLEQINADFRRAAVQINELEETLERQDPSLRS
jgi:hypothetical protein